MRTKKRFVLIIIIVSVCFSMFGQYHKAAEKMTGVVTATSLNVRTGYLCPDFTRRRE